MKRGNKMDQLASRWEKAKLTPVFYHTTFIENAPRILKQQTIVANKGESICGAKNGLVSLSDRITKGIVEFFGNVTFKFDAIGLYKRNKAISPKNYGSNIRKLYEEIPLFENEWIAPHEVKFDLTDINEVLLIKSKLFRETKFEGLIKILERKGIEYCFFSERYLSDNDVSDMTNYLSRMRGWKKFSKMAQHV